MNQRFRPLRCVLSAVAASAALVACSGMGGMYSSGGSSSSALKLSGDQEVPPVTTQASGTGAIKVSGDGSVSGGVKTTGMSGTMAHIHNAAAGKNGPVVLPLVKGGEGEWNVPAGAKLTAEQMKAYQAGELYVNVHTEQNKGGEVRAQLKP